VEDIDVADNVRAELARRRLTARQLAREMGVSEGALRARLRGDVVFHAAEVANIARHLDMTIDELLREDTK